jgi:SAM-dependent methyltransferase
VTRILEPFDYQRYLLSKRSVEERCLNAQVWSGLIGHLASLRDRPVRILELGGGVGSMALRLLNSPPVAIAHYTIVDASADSLAVARTEIAAAGPPWSFDFVTADIYAFLARQGGGSWDLLISHALLDLLDLPIALPRLLACLRPAGVFYFPINYDGLTIFEPEIDAKFERELFASYHRTMDERVVEGKPSGDHLTGRHLLTALPAAGAQIVAAGDSDWVVVPQEGTYPADEAYFLACILQTIEGALTDLPGLDQTRLQLWLEKRRVQLAHRELILIAHHLDIFGVLPG